jgi:hypothetical protein
VAPDPRPHDRIVELANLPSRFEADALLAVLATNGISATANYGDAGGWAPNFGTTDGFRVLVFEQDLDDARSLLAEG